MIESKLLEVPLSAMPRERLERYGAKVLETHELLAILLRTGSKDLNVLQLAVVVLNTFEDLHSLKMASLDELMHINGIGRTKAIELKAAMELGVRLSNAAQMKLGKITSTKMAGQWIVQELKDAYQEHLVALVRPMPLICMSSSRLAIFSECKSSKVFKTTTASCRTFKSLDPVRSKIASNSCVSSTLAPYRSRRSRGMALKGTSNNFDSIIVTLPLCFLYKELRCLFFFGLTVLPPMTNFGDKIQ